MTDLGIGVIGCGNISAAYMRLAPMFRGVDIRACADIDEEAARSRAEEFGIRAETVSNLLAADDIAIVINLTIPAAHFEVSRAALEAGKHVYSEKPFALSLADGESLVRLAAARGLRVGSAPDTFLGGAHQLARHILDAGTVGRITSGTCFVQNMGMEMWHPNPDFFFKAGGGPVLDLGPYYIANLVQLLGPVARVAAMGSKGRATRVIASQPRRGETMEVDVPTTAHAVLEFHSGAQIMFGASWDVCQHGHSNMELYGLNGTLHVPDPNFFGGEVRHTQGAHFANLTPDWPHPFSVANHEGHANYRAAGLADMALAIVEDRPHRCGSEFSLHVVDVLTAILRSGGERAFIETRTTCDRPAPLDPEAARSMLADASKSANPAGSAF